MHLVTTARIKDQQLLEFLKIGDEDDELGESMVAIEAGSRRHHVPKFCATRWSARVSTLSALIAKYTVKNGVFQNSRLGCLYVHSSTTPNRVFLKPPFEGVTGHP